MKSKLTVAEVKADFITLSHAPIGLYSLNRDLNKVVIVTGCAGFKRAVSIDNLEETWTDFPNLELIPLPKGSSVTLTN